MNERPPHHHARPCCGAESTPHADRSSEATESNEPGEGGSLADHLLACRPAEHDEGSSDAGYTFDPDAPVLVSIRWKDAESQGGPTWEDTDDMLEFARRPLTEVLTVGVLLHMDHEQIAVTDTVALDQMGGVTKIPRGWVERVEVLGPIPSDLLNPGTPTRAADDGVDRLDDPASDHHDDRNESDRLPRRVG